MKNIRISIIISLLAVISLSCSIPSISGLMATETPVPTNTPIPTLTALPTATTMVLPTATLIPIPSQVPTSQIQSSTTTQNGNEEISIITDNSFTVDTWSYIVGIMQNNTQNTIEYVDLSVLIYDANNTLIATEDIYPFLDKIAPGDTSPFMVYSDAWGQGTTYDFLVEGYSVSTDPIPTGMDFLTYNSYDDGYDLYLVGEVQNNSDKLMSYVKISGVLYAADGTMLNANYTYAMINYIAPGEKSPFKIWFSDGWEEADNYEMQVLGSYDEYSTPQAMEVTDYTITNDSGTCTINGNVKNVGTAEVTYATIVAVFYDASNTVLNAEWNYTSTDALAVGASSPFTITSYSCPTYDHLEVYAGG